MNEEEGENRSSLSSLRARLRLAEGVEVAVPAGLNCPVHGEDHARNGRLISIWSRTMDPKTDWFFSKFAIASRQCR